MKTDPIIYNNDSFIKCFDWTSKTNTYFLTAAETVFGQLRALRDGSRCYCVSLTRGQCVSVVTRLSVWTLPEPSVLAALDRFEEELADLRTRPSLPTIPQQAFQRQSFTTRQNTVTSGEAEQSGKCCL